VNVISHGTGWLTLPASDERRTSRPRSREVTGNETKVSVAAEGVLIARPLGAKKASASS